jgi:hypothetical protein
MSISPSLQKDLAIIYVVLPGRASLYERPVNLDAAKAAHAEFRRVMREHGVKVRATPLRPRFHILILTDIPERQESSISLNIWSPQWPAMPFIKGTKAQGHNLGL